MDNVCHTLVGAALAETGLKRRTRLGTATLMIGANFPDIDVVTVPFGRAIEMRRGWTHGVLALVVLPVVLTALMLAWDRWQGREGDESPHVHPREVLLLSALSIVTHPTLDWMNSYGMRWLMPFSGRWFYGDALFIIDPWLLLVLGAGVWASRRRQRTGGAHPWRPARVAAVVAVGYVLAMVGLHAVARRRAEEELARRGRVQRALYVMPSPGNPLRWTLLGDDGERYWPGSLSLAPNRRDRVVLSATPIEKHADDPAALAAARTASGRRFLGWARMPYFEIERRGAAAHVTITDARYGASVELLVD